MSLTNKPYTITIRNRPQFTLKVVNRNLIDAPTVILWAGLNIASQITYIYDPVPDLIEDNDPTYFYFGWNNVNGYWRIQQQNRDTSETLTTTGQTNPSYPTLIDVWPNKDALSYS